MSVLVSKIDLGILGLGALAVFLIVRGGGKFLEGLKFPSIGDITFPDFNLPEINITTGAEDVAKTITESFDTGIGRVLDIITGGTGNIDAGQAGIRTPATQEQIDAAGHAIPSNQPEGSTVKIIQDAMGNITKIFSGGQTILTPEGPPLPPDRPLNLTQLAEQSRTIEDFQAQQNPNFVNQGGFVGGGIFDTPIENLSLSQIIDRFNVTASQAANIKAESQNNFGDFDFGTNTGSGIGSVFSDPNLNPLIDRGNVSNQQFAGLTATEIAQRLTGGIINNF